MKRLFLPLLFSIVALTVSPGGAGASSSRDDGNSGPSVTPTFSAQPQSLTLIAGQTANFSASAVGNPRPSISWLFSTDGGATYRAVSSEDSRIRFVATLAQSGYRFEAVARSSAGSATSNPATLTVVSSTTPLAPTVTANPTSASAAVGGTARFSASASGNPVPTIQWQYSSDGGVTYQNVPSASTSSQLSFTVVASMAGYLFRAVFSNDSGSATTLPAQLFVNRSDEESTAPTAVAPAITHNPSDISVFAGGRAIFVATATGRPQPTVQWQSSVDGGSTFQNVAGGTSVSLTLNTNIGLDGFKYRAVFTNASGIAVSSPATLHVSAPSGPTTTTVPAPTTTTTRPPTTTTTVRTTTTTVRSTTTTTTVPAPTTTTTRPPTTTTTAPTTTTTVRSTTTTTTTTIPPVSSYPVIATSPVDTMVQSGKSVTFYSSATGTPTPTVQWSVSSDSGVTFTPITGATTANYTFTPTTSMSGYVYEATYTNTNGTATTAAATLTVTLQTILNSNNWSGYVATGRTFTGVSGTWIVPAANCAGHANAYASQWVGIDGYGSSTVEQLGTVVTCTNGVTNYGAWYEMYGISSIAGGASINLPNADSVQPGDQITATVDFSAGVWTLSMTDATANWSFSIALTNLSTTPAEVSAEWVVERPLICGAGFGASCQLANMAPTPITTFTNISASVNGVSAPATAYTLQIIQMVNGATPLATPGPLSAGGTSFSVTSTA